MAVLIPIPAFEADEIELALAEEMGQPDGSARSKLRFTAALGVPRFGRVDVRDADLLAPVAEGIAVNHAIGGSRGAAFGKGYSARAGALGRKRSAPHMLFSNRALAIWARTAAVAALFAIVVLPMVWR